jgi:hypothetical protein
VCVCVSVYLCVLLTAHWALPSVAIGAHAQHQLAAVDLGSFDLGQQSVGGSRSVERGLPFSLSQCFWYTCAACVPVCVSVSVCLSVCVCVCLDAFLLVKDVNALERKFLEVKKWDRDVSIFLLPSVCVCLSVCLSVVYLFVCPSFFKSVCLPILLSVSVSVCVRVCVLMLVMQVLSYNVGMKASEYAKYYFDLRQRSTEGKFESVKPLTQQEVPCTTVAGGGVVAVLLLLVVVGVPEPD